MAVYPVSFDIARPEKFERPHVFLRIVVLIILSILGGAFGWILGLVYLLFPALAAIFISQKGAERFLQEDGPRMTGWIRWVMALYAYLGLVTDRFPTEKPEEIVRVEIQTGGTPTVGSALLRIILAIPSAFVLGILGLISGIIWIIAAIMVLIQENYPDGLFGFQVGVLRWEARLLGYQASLVEPYPPFALDTGTGTAAT
ncbi:MAG: DUF4389 domain-containing protein [Dehalococcoidia bacterium]|nr:DUF4389 domain-containing protein [Dehalococcoidia bacterium]